MLEALLIVAGAQEPVQVTVTRTPFDKLGATRLVLTSTNASGEVTDTIEVAPTAFLVRTVWLGGAVDGHWTQDAQLERLDQRILISGDEARTRIANQDFSRVLDFDTASLHKTLYEGQPSHATTPVSHPMFGDEPVNIDSALVDLMPLLWDLGWPTNNSCENQDGQVIIGFELSSCADEFAEAITRHVRPSTTDGLDAEHVYSRLSGDLEADDWQDYRRHRAWRFGAAFARDYSYPAGDGAPFTAPPDVAVAVGVRFPRADLPVVVAALREALGRTS